MTAQKSRLKKSHALKMALFMFITVRDNGFDPEALNRGEWRGLMPYMALIHQRIEGNLMPCMALSHQQLKEMGSLENTSTGLVPLSRLVTAWRTPLNKQRNDKENNQGSSGQQPYKCEAT